MNKSLSEITREGVEAVVAKLVHEDEAVSLSAGRKLLAEAKSFGLTPKDYLTLKIDVNKSENPERYRDGNGQLNGFQAALTYLNLPTRDDFAQGVTLNLASDTFQTHPGSRVLFPEVINAVLQYKYRQDANIERVEPIIAQTRTISGTVAVTNVVDDSADTYKHWVPVAELARVPVKTIRLTDKSVTFYKFGSGVRTSYEFDRRARLDMIVPFLARCEREKEMGKVGAVTDYLINGDGTAGNPAAPVTRQSAYNTKVGENAVANKLSRKHILRWLMDLYSRGIYVDTLVGNMDTAADLLEMTVVPTTGNVNTEGQNLQAGGFTISGLPLFGGALRFALSTTAPAGRIIAEARGETIEQLIEAGSIIQESERNLENQSITAYSTENSGFAFVYGDTRAVLDYANL